MRSYLAPGLPHALFEALAVHLSGTLRTDVDLGFDESRSGPRRGEDEPFTSGAVDVAFLCASSYVWLTEPATPAVELVGAAWVPTDPRSAGRAIYFGDVLARRGGPASLTRLRGCRVAYNDDVSLSGYHSLRLALTATGIDEADVDLRRSGSHLASLQQLEDGAVDAAAVDSNVWRRIAAQRPDLTRHLQAIAALGPHPTQPVVVRRGLDPAVRDAIGEGLRGAMATPSVAAAMRDAQLARFTTVADDHFAGLRTQMATLRAATTTG